MHPNTIQMREVPEAGGQALAPSSVSMLPCSYPYRQALVFRFPYRRIFVPGHR